MKNEIAISVIIPVYNSEKFLQECLDSVIKQTIRNIEIICVDDGSTDGSAKILEKYKQDDSRIKIFKQEHRGGGAARNLGLKVASGEYLSFLDSDDYFEYDMLEKIYLRCKNVGADVGVFGVMCYHQATGAENYEPSGLRIDHLPEKNVFCWRDLPEYIFNTFHNWAWNKLFLREFILEKEILFQEISRTNDLLFTNKALILASQIVILDEALVHYRVQVTDNCQSTNFLYPEDFYNAFKALKSFLKEQKIWNNVSTSYRNHALDGCIANLNSLEFGAAHQNLYNQLKKQIFKELEVDQLTDEDVLKENLDKKKWYDLIVSGSYLDYVKARADEYRILFRNLQFSSYLKYADLRKCIAEKEQENEELKARCGNLEQENLLRFIKRKYL